MTNIDDSTQTPPGYWFGVIEGRLHERMRDALADLDLRRGSWRILHTLADGPATPEELAHRLPDGGRRPHRAGSGDPRERFGRVAHPGWRSQEPRDEQAYAETGGRPQTQPDERPTDADGSAEPERHAPGHERGHGRHPEHGGGPEYPQDHGLDHEHDHDHHDHHDHGHHHDHDHHGHHHFEQAFERGYVRGFDRGFAFGAARAGYGPAAPFRGGRGYGRGYGPTPGASFPGAHGYGPFGAAAYAPGRPGHPFSDDPHQGRGHDRGHRRGYRIHRVLADFVERGWVWFDGDRATLTDEGRAAHDRASERVARVRRELARGIPEGDYATTMATLETMARNLGWRPAEKDGGSPTGEPRMDA